MKDARVFLSVLSSRLPRPCRTDLVLPHHAPKVNKRVGHGSLRCNVAVGVVVAVDPACVDIVGAGISRNDGQNDTGVVVGVDVGIPVLQPVWLLQGLLDRLYSRDQRCDSA